MSKFSVDDYASALTALLPTGDVWKLEPDSIQSLVIQSLADAYQQSDDDAFQLLKGAFPSTATTLLYEWEQTLGLPDNCAIGETDSIALRQRAVTAKLFATGGQSVDYFINVAAALGYTVTVTEYRRARAGRSACGAALNGDDWPSTWLITAPSTTVNYAQAGANYCSDPLRSWGNKSLECRLKKLAPSHTIILFGYSS